MDVMIVLYHSYDARSFRPLWTLEELRLPYELVRVPFPPRSECAGYLDLNPIGTVPTLLDDGSRMTESAAMCQYIVDRYAKGELSVGVDDPSYAQYLNWIHFGEATLTFPQTLVLRYTRLEPEDRRNPQVAEDYTRWFLSRLRAVTAAVDESEYLLGFRFTIADISVGYALLLADDLGLGTHFSPAVGAYWQRLQNRPGFQRAKAAQDKAPVLTSV
jgi:glutathione S-transferase